MPVKHVNVSVSRCSMARIAKMMHNLGISGCFKDDYNTNSQIL